MSLFGTILLYFALMTSIAQCLIPLYGYYRNHFYLFYASKILSISSQILIWSAYILLTLAFVLNDFSIIYVAKHSHETLPFWYQITALWGAHEGSMLLWILVLQIWSLFYILTTRVNRELVLSFLGGISSLFLLFLLFSSNPFISSPDKFMGQDLNPLLQDPGFIFHPPFLFMGYVGFSVSFAIALSALVQKNIELIFVTTRKFVLTAFCFLTIGIMLGAWWAYRVLGWGGFWFWDPVENASLLPWLSGIALIHILMVAEKKVHARPFALLLLLMTFCLSVLGTFLVRSGVLISVHTFASDPSRGIFLLIILGIFVAVAFIAYLWRFSTISLKDELTFSLTRESWLFVASLLWLFAMLTVLVGTLYPLIIDVLNLGMLSVGAPYFNSVLLPFVVLILASVSLAVLTKGQSFSALLKQTIIWFASIFIFSMITLYYLTNTFLFAIPLLLSLALSVMISHFFCYRHMLGATMAHCGFSLMVIGILLASVMSIEKDIKMSVGEHTFLGPYQFSLASIHSIEGSNFRGVRASVDVLKDKHYVTTLLPEKRIYPIRDMIISKVDIHPSIFRDLYVTLGEPINANTWVLRIYYKPFIRFILFGAIFIVIGCVISLFKKR